VGLGNPGAAYAETRHNAGFWLADALHDRWRLPPFRRRGPALGSGGPTPAGEVYLLKPQTMMNDSGAALSGLRAAAPEAPLDDLLLLVDDVAIPSGAFRIRAGGSAGGHNGLKSVEAAIGTRAYARLRIGVGPAPPLYDEDSLPDFVLSPLPPDERQAVTDLLPAMGDAVECWMTEGVDRAMALFNRRPAAEN
jgi:PTH1 family peptidyl-tRNA hydrolase